MTFREQILTLLQGGTPDRVPWFGDLDYWAGSLIGHGQKPAGFQASPAYIDWHLDLGVGYYLQGHFPFRTHDDQVEVRERRDGLLWHREFITPKGTLRECWQRLPEDFTEAPIEHLVKSAADLPAYQFLHAHRRYEPDYEPARQRLAQLQRTGAGVMLAYLPKSPLMQLVALDAGIVAVTELAYDEPDLFAETMAVVEESHDRAAQVALASPAEVLMIPENLSAEMVGPDLFEPYMRPYQAKWAAAIRAAGKFSCIHFDGTLKGLLRQETRVGLDFLEALTPAPVGDLAVADWAEFAGTTETIFWGGIPGGYFTPLVDDAEFDAFVRATLEIMRQHPRYVLGVADQVPPIGLESRVRRVRELVEEAGGYAVK
jgi:hypothetical protein